LSLQGGGSLNYEVGAPFYGINILVKKKTYGAQIVLKTTSK